MAFTDKELETIKYALEYLHDADLSDYGDDNIRTLEGLMDKFDMSYTSQL